MERLVRPLGEVEMEQGLENSRILPGRRNIRGQGQAQKSASASPASHLEAWPMTHPAQTYEGSAVVVSASFKG